MPITQNQLIPCQREAFDIPRDVAYFNCAYLSPLLNAVGAAGRQGIDSKARPWQVTAPDFFSDSEKARQLFARMVGAQANDIAILPAVSYGIGIAARNIPLAANQRILVLAEQFPSNFYPWLEKVNGDRQRLYIVPRPADGQWTEAVLSALDKGIGIAALPNCHWTDCSLIDLEAVGQRCEELDIPLVLDLTQSLGAMPFDIERVRPAFVVSASYKWLLGPYSLAFMYIAPRYQQGVPLEFNWISRKDSEQFAGLVAYTSQFGPGAVRFDVGERSNFILLPMAIAAMEQLHDWGVANIAATLGTYTEQLASEAKHLGFTSSAHRGGHFLGLRYKDGLPKNLGEKLQAGGVYVSLRGDALRVAPHLYNDRQDMDRLFTLLEQALS